MDRQTHFTPYEVSAHNTSDDLWVSFLGKVCDLTPLMTKHKGDILLVPIIECAGKDISHWFYTETKDIRTHVDRLTGCVQYYTPRGRFLHVPPPCPRTDWAADFGVPWWRDNQYVVGRLSAKTRWIRIINTLTSQEQLMEVCCEETLGEILRRYSYYNSHASSYTWKHHGACLDMSKTLSENGIADEDEALERCRLDRDHYTQSVFLYFNDDLTDL